MAEVEMTLLDEVQIESLRIFDKIGTNAAITDYAIALGGYVSDSCYTKGNEGDLKERAGYYWIQPDTDSYYYDDEVSFKFVWEDNSIEKQDGDTRDCGIRVVLPYYYILQFATNIERGEDGICRITAGYFPTWAVSKDMQKNLETKFIANNSSLTKGDNSYTIDAKNWDQFNKKFEPLEQTDWMLSNGKRYVRLIMKPNEGESIKLSNKESYHEGDAIWFETIPVYWYGIPKENIAFTKNIILSGIQAHHESLLGWDFPTTDMYHYLNTYLIKEMGLLDLQKKKDSSELSNDIEKIRKLLEFVTATPELTTEERVTLELLIGNKKHSSFSISETVNILGKEEDEVKELQESALQKLSIYQENIDSLSRSNGNKGPVKSKKR